MPKNNKKDRNKNQNLIEVELKRNSQTSVKFITDEYPNEKKNLVFLCINMFFKYSGFFWWDDINDNPTLMFD